MINPLITGFINPINYYKNPLTIVKRLHINYKNIQGSTAAIRSPDVSLALPSTLKLFTCEIHCWDTPVNGIQLDIPIMYTYLTYIYICTYIYISIYICVSYILCVYIIYKCVCHMRHSENLIHMKTLGLKYIQPNQPMYRNSVIPRLLVDVMMFLSWCRGPVVPHIYPAPFRGEHQTQHQRQSTTYVI